MSNDLLRQLPSVDRLLNHLSAQRLVQTYGHDLAVEALRSAVEEARQQIVEGGSSVPGDAILIGAAHETLADWLHPTLRRVINATGVIVHTNLGRAPLSDEALDAIQSVGGGYSTLEYDLSSGERGSRSTHAEALLQRLTGAEAAFVVNNNAAATMLALAALAGPTRNWPEGRGAIISRGELVEIGGGYRMPDVMTQSGAHMVEIGTTNRTHLSDYEQALDERSALIMHVHRSNFAIVGFTIRPETSELADLAHAHNLLFVDDLGSGALYDTSHYGLKPEPTVQESLSAGADVVMFSGDKLLGGPQAGVLLGRADVIAQLRRHPLARAVRPDKLCLAGLSATLAAHIKGEANRQVPVWQMISVTVDDLGERVHTWADDLKAVGLTVEVIDSQSVVGGGSLPGESLPTRVLAIHTDSPDEAAARLRACDPPVIVRREDDLLIVDPRTVLSRDEADLLTGLKSLE